MQTIRQFFTTDFTPYFFQKKEEKNKLNVLFYILFLGVFFALKTNFHECWKDEWQAWFVARDMSWSEMFGFLYYEGHPSLWYIYLKIITSIKSSFLPFLSDEIVLQSAHFALFAAFSYWILFKMNFSNVVKYALLFGFYFGFEYGMVNRGYILVLLLTFIAATFIQKDDTKIWKLALVLLLLCQTEAQGVIVACGLLLYVLLKKYFSEGLKKSVQNIDIQLLTGSVVLGIGFFVATIFPRGYSEDLARAYNSNQKGIGESLVIAFQGLLANTFWIGAIDDTNVFGVSILGIVLSILLAMGLIYFFKEKRNLLFTFLLTFLAFYVFAAFIFVGGVRQWGILLVFFFALFFIGQKENLKINGIKLLIISSILAFQCYYNSLAWFKEIQYPFSNAKACATFLNEQKIPSKVPIVAINPFETGVLNGYLDRNLYALPKGETFTYFRWLEKVYLPSEAELRLFSDYKKVSGIVVVTNNPLSIQRYPNLQLWKKFDDYSIKGENFWVYTLKK